MNELESQFEKLKSLLGEALIKIAYLEVENTNLKADRSNLERTLGVYCKALGRKENASARGRLRKLRIEAEVAELINGKAS